MIDNTRLSLIALASGCLVLAGCNDDNFDVSKQYGPDPVLPAATSSILPDLKVAEVVGWRAGQTPRVPDGLVVTPFATGLANPRTVHTLPNGDVLVVQSKAPPGKPINRPKDIIRNFIMSIASGGSAAQPETNRITLLRDADRNGTVDERVDLLTGLNSPFGIAWHEDTLYVAAADAILSYPYTLGQTTITAQPTVLTPLPGGPVSAAPPAGCPRPETGRPGRAPGGRSAGRSGRWPPPQRRRPARRAAPR